MMQIIHDAEISPTSVGDMATNMKYIDVFLLTILSWQSILSEGSYQELISPWKCELDLSSHIHIPSSYVRQIL